MAEHGKSFRFSSAEAPITIAAMFVISAALNRCRIIEQMTDFLGIFCKFGYAKFMLILLGLVALISAFVNNTPVVVVLLPAIFTLSRKLGVSSSKMLIPVSYASIFGGCCTLVVTSTNILANGIILQQKFINLEPIGMFEFSKTGLPYSLFHWVFWFYFPSTSCLKGRTHKYSF